MTVGELIEELSKFNKYSPVTASLNDVHCGLDGKITVHKHRAWDKKTNSEKWAVDIAGCTKEYLDSFRGKPYKTENEQE